MEPKRTHRPNAAPPRPSIGLVLGGGAARGFAHIGVIRTLIAKGIMPDIITGTSIGAVVGGCYAAGKLDEVEAWGRSLTRRSLLGYLDVSFSGIGPASAAASSPTSSTEALGDMTIDKLPVRFAAIATEIGTGHEIWITRGRARRRDARLLRAARHLSADADRRTLAGGRRAGQSGAGVGRARARRAPGDRRQRQHRHVRPRHDHSGSGRPSTEAEPPLEEEVASRGLFGLFGAEKSRQAPLLRRPRAGPACRP